MSILLNAYVLIRTYRSARLGDAARLLIPAAIIVAPTLLIASTIRTPTLTLVSGIVIVVATALAFSQLWWAVIGLIVGTIVGSIFTGRVPEESSAP
ncbi:MAG: hypothetical protein EPN48_15180 [Microbacteriaceae bacterium]|nr:MAG: hypothetical protein EPN48_15180 [Microbacteriaceae bacterium]